MEERPAEQCSCLRYEIVYVQVFRVGSPLYEK